MSHGVNPTTLHMCFLCRQRAARIVEGGRPIAGNRVLRRRLECTLCGRRSASYEMGADAYDELRTAQETLLRIRQILGADQFVDLAPLPGGDLDREDTHPCADCVHWDKDDCSLGLPELDPRFCSAYQPASNATRPRTTQS